MIVPPIESFSRQCVTTTTTWSSTTRYWKCSWTTKCIALFFLSPYFEVAPFWSGKYVSLFYLVPVWTSFYKLYFRLSYWYHKLQKFDLWNHCKINSVLIKLSVQFIWLLICVSIMLFGVLLEFFCIWGEYLHLQKLVKEQCTTFWEGEIWCLDCAALKEEHIWRIWRVLKIIKQIQKLWGQNTRWISPF